MGILSRLFIQSDVAGRPATAFSNLAALSSVALIVAAPAAAQVEKTVYEHSKILPADGRAGDGFGAPVALDADALICGGTGESLGGHSVGAAYVFRFDPASRTWEQEAKLLASDASAGDCFGTAVVIQGDLAVVGAFGNAELGDMAGAAYVYRHEPPGPMWREEAKLLASDGEAGDAFGFSVSISGDVIAVGAHGDDLYRGSAYVYRYDPGLRAWVEEAKLIAADGVEDDWFGRAVAVDGEVVLAGAPHDDDLGAASGSAYVFRHDAGAGWIEETKLVASDGGAGDLLGFAAALSGTRALLGRSDEAAYLFRYDGVAAGWGEECKLLPRAPARAFGQAVALTGERALVGAECSSHSGFHSGSAYLFRHDASAGAWELESVLVPVDGRREEFFGRAVALHGGRAAISKRFDDDNGEQSGSAYLVETEELVFTPERPARGQELTITARNLRPDSPAHLFHGLSGKQDTYFAELDVVLGMRHPQRARLPVWPDAGGEASWRLVVPATVASRFVWLQVAQHRSKTHMLLAAMP